MHCHSVCHSIFLSRICVCVRSWILIFIWSKPICIKTVRTALINQAIYALNIQSQRVSLKWVCSWSLVFGFRFVWFIFHSFTWITFKMKWREDKRTIKPTQFKTRFRIILVNCFLACYLLLLIIIYFETIGLGQSIYLPSLLNCLIIIGH